MNFGLLSAASTVTKRRVRDRKERHRLQVEEALTNLDRWIEHVGS
jgi:hypothetical protein